MNDFKEEKTDFFFQQNHIGREHWGNDFHTYSVVWTNSRLIIASSVEIHMHFPNEYPLMAVDRSYEEIFSILTTAVNE